MSGCGGKLNESAVVIAVDGKSATVKMVRSPACSNDHKDCPWGSFTRQEALSEFTIEALNPVQAKPDDTVKIEIETGDYFKALFLVFILPIIGILGGYLLGLAAAPLFGLANHGQIVAGVLSVAGILMSLLILRHEGKRFKPEYIITRVLPKSTLPE